MHCMKLASSGAIPRLKGAVSRAGFSLIELMIAVAIVGILLFVALPGYERVVLKGNRLAAKASLMDVVSRQEQYFFNHKEYATTLTGLGLPSPYFVDGQVQSTTLASAVYTVSLVLVDGRYEGSTATPLNRQLGDRACMAFSISRIGARSVSGGLAYTPAECW